MIEQKYVDVRDSIPELLISIYYNLLNCGVGILSATFNLLVDPKSGSRERESSSRSSPIGAYPMELYL